MVGAEQRPGSEQFGERSASDQAFTVGNAIDLVGNIRALVDQERARRGEDFNAAMWLGGNLDSMATAAYFDSQTVLLPSQERAIAEDKHQFLWGLRVAWYLRAYQEVDGEHNYYIYRDIEGYASAYQTRSVILPLLGVSLLDAMAEALDIPHTPGQSEFNVHPLLIGAIDKVMSHQNPMPTLEEVRQAINPKPENIIDPEQ